MLHVFEIMSALRTPSALCLSVAKASAQVTLEEVHHPPCRGWRTRQAQSAVFLNGSCVALDLFEQRFSFVSALLRLFGERFCGIACFERSGSGSARFRCVSESRGFPFWDTLPDAPRVAQNCLPSAIVGAKPLFAATLPCAEGNHNRTRTTPH